MFVRCLTASEADLRYRLQLSFAATALLSPRSEAGAVVQRVLLLRQIQMRGLLFKGPRSSARFFNGQYSTPWAAAR